MSNLSILLLIAHHTSLFLFYRSTSNFGLLFFRYIATFQINVHAIFIHSLIFMLIFPDRVARQQFHGSK